jgi:hypothetical protein
MARLLIKTIILSVLVSNAAWGSTLAKVEIVFTGKASGGTLIIGNTLNRNVDYVSVETEPGEDAGSVVKKLARAIVYDSYLFGFPDNVNLEKMVQQIISGDAIKIVGGATGGYFTAGTETGLGIPEPPKFLTANYDKASNQLKLRWENPPGNYDKIALLLRWNSDDIGGMVFLPSNATQYVISRDINSINDSDIWVIGIKGDLKRGVPSSPAAITLSANGTVQEELYGIPFKDGISPNWKAWGINGIKKENYKCLTEEKFVPGKRSHRIKNNSQKPYRQALQIPEGGGTSGIWRKFLGLSPGHKYRISARLNTLEMPSDGNNWSFSLHAVADKKAESELSARQMAGIEALPDGKKGADAHRLKKLDAKTITKGKYNEYSDEITLPKDSNSITVWLRLTGTSKAEVGFDWIKLEDLEVQ